MWLPHLWHRMWLQYLWHTHNVASIPVAHNVAAIPVAHSVAAVPVAYNVAAVPVAHNARLGVPTASPGISEKRRITCPFQESNSKLSSPCLVTVLTELSGLPKNEISHAYVRVAVNKIKDCMAKRIFGLRERRT